jgi:hypothetical protein
LEGIVKKDSHLDLQQGQPRDQQIQQRPESNLLQAILNLHRVHSLVCGLYDLEAGYRLKD